MYSVLDVCRFIINYSNECGYSISNLKLQKLLYFIQAYFLISDNGSPCFNEEIQAWTFGPVCPSAYRVYKIYGYSNIPKIDFYYRFDRERGISKVMFDSECIDESSRKMIIDVIEEFKDTSASELVNLTHAQLPWKEAYELGKNTVISQKAIRDYFNEQ